MEEREEFVGKVRELIEVTLECVDGLPYYLKLLAFPVLLRYLVSYLDPDLE